ncbi:MAG: FkbM family methyltransferase [Saprospiraceae bacterium]
MYNRGGRACCSRASTARVCLGRLNTRKRTGTWHLIAIFAGKIEKERLLGQNNSYFSMQSIFRRVRGRFLKWTERKLRIPIEKGVQIERIGTPYGGWLIPKNRLNETSVCYLVGAGEDISFDAGVAAAYGAQVHIFDPTPRAIAHAEQFLANLINGSPAPCNTSPTGFYPDYSPALASLLHFHPYGIWDDDTTLEFFAPRNEAHVSHSLVNLQHSEKSIKVPVRRLNSVMQQLGHRKIDLLKLDIEGAEYQVINAILKDHIEIDMMCVEYDESAANHLDGKYLLRIEGSLRALLDSGFRVVAKEPDCHNYTLVHTRCL